MIGHMGTISTAAMILINPVQGLMIGALCGLSQAAGSVLCSLAVILLSPLYVQIYQVEEAVKILTKEILFAYALIAPFKVLNMILGGGIIRSGGKTKYVMHIDLFGTWCLGVPLGLLAAFVWNLSIPYIYFILSLEECARFGISLSFLKRKNGCSV